MNVTLESAWKRESVVPMSSASPADNLVNAYRFHKARLVAHWRPTSNGLKSIPTRFSEAALTYARGDMANGFPRYCDGKLYPPTAKQSDGLVWVDTDRVALRLVGKVEPESARFITREGLGWLTDPYGHSARDGTGLVWGVVYQLPGSRGVARYVAGYVYGGMGEGATLDLARVYTSTDNYWDGSAQENDATRDAAYAADSMARRAAEDEREYQCAWQAGRRFAELGEEAVSARRQLNALLLERRAVKGNGSAYPAICANIRDKVDSLLEQIREARAKRAKLRDGEPDETDSPLYYWNPRNPSHVAAFDDAAGNA